MRTQNDDLFQPDRRKQPRAGASDRRMKPRPTWKLRIQGAIIALAVLCGIFAAVYFSSRR